MVTTAFYPGSFDPVTLGHLDIIRRSVRLFDKLVIGVGIHDAKRPMFSADERIEMLAGICRDCADTRDAAVEITTFDNLAVNAAKSVGAQVIVRGLRNATDLDYEAQMGHMNHAMAPDVDTVFLSSSPQFSHIAASLVRQIAHMGGDVSSFVAPSVAQRLANKVSASPIS